MNSRNESPRSMARALRAGGIVAYPTESVYGLGCDPGNMDALRRLIDLKQRDAAQGLILIAANTRQLQRWARLEGLPLEQEILASWPGPVTWVVPAKPSVSRLITGGRDSVAVRVTGHAEAAALCRAFGGALISTSANPSGREPALDADQVRAYFPDQLAGVLDGRTGGRGRPSEIRDGRNGVVIRRG